MYIPLPYVPSRGLSRPGDPDGLASRRKAAKLHLTPHWQEINLNFVMSL